MGRPRKPYFRSSDGWWVSRFNGEYVKLAKGESEKKSALKKFHELMALEQANPPVESGHHTVASVIELYLTHMQPRYAERSYYERKIILQSFAEAHGFRKVNDKDCLPLHMTSWLDKQTTWKSDWTKATAVAVVHAPFNWACKQRLITANPFRGVSQREGAPRRPMTDDEFHRLLEAAKGKQTKSKPTPGERFIELVRFLRLTGARPCEASHLSWENINTESGVIELLRHKTTNTQTEPKPRIIILDQETVELLLTIRKRNEAGPLVFLNHRRSAWNRSSLSLRMQRSREKAGIPAEVKLYGLRHAYGTRAIVNGVDLKTLSELMGHTTTRMTEHYLHMAGQRTHLSEALKKINQASPEPKPPQVA